MPFCWFCHEAAQLYREMHVSVQVGINFFEWLDLLFLMEHYSVFKTLMLKFYDNYRFSLMSEFSGFVW